MTAVLGTATLVAAWRTGSTGAPGQLAGVQVVTPVAVAPASPGRTATSGRTAPARAKRGTAPTKTPTTAAAPAPPVRRTIDGAVVATPYGQVQVQAVVKGTQLIDVVALHLTDSSSTSRDISAGAAPVLRQEALRAGSAKVDVVSGATYTSQGYQASLQAALDAAAR